ncbi:MAG: nucleotidyltransferase family protein [Armatimonadota bacterium]|nr:nucleotidyltransferase family protein [Armatimonadota bacterium]MDR7438730.1 nucleotidyltransferase family protein [Armatimonadota bacterium]MDR7561946.1 nucleotidyltransferase family protein [Armatimonadota bacterium]MDR7568046.1 nucleotidyltransferase family protein [Armatimonadota bacterium]MDR7601857.1 nucleotidyltransferase family protein [Armatimonadota bacterium]
MSGLACVVLAAGSSRRMGQPKLLLRLGGKTLLRRAVETALGVCGRVAVVVGPEADRMRAELQDLPVEVVENPEHELGLSTSLRRGIEAVAEAEAVLLLLADQPALTPQHLQRLVETWRRSGARIVACTYRGTVGPPTLFHRTLLPELKALRGDVGAKPILEAHRDEAIFVPLEEAALDVDTPEDWVRVQESIRPS